MNQQLRECLPCDRYHCPGCDKHTTNPPPTYCGDCYKRFTDPDYLVKKMISELESKVDEILKILKEKK